MPQKFSKALLELSQKFLELSAIKYQIIEALHHSQCSDLQNNSLPNQIIDAFQLQNVLSKKLGYIVDLKYLNKKLFATDKVLSPTVLCQYLGIGHTSRTKNILNVIYLQAFCELVLLQSKIFSLFQEIKSIIQKNADSLFQLIDINGMEVIDTFSIVNFVRTYSGCTISSKSASEIIYLIKGGKGEYLHRQEWNKCFLPQFGGIRSNKPRSTQKRLNKYRSYEKIQSIKSNNKCISKEEHEISNTLIMPSTFVSSFTKGYLQNKRSIARHSRHDIQNLLVHKSQAHKSRNSQKLYQYTKYSHYQDYYNQFPLKLRQNSVNKIYGEPSTRINKLAVQQKQPYQVYLDSKKIVKIKSDFIDYLSSLNQHLNKKEQLVYRICTYPDFNLFNAFNILDCYDLGGINYGEFCRQLNNLGVSVEDDNKLAFWNETANQNSHGLSYQNFIQIFNIKNNRSYNEEVKNRYPIIKRFQGITSWKKQLQYSYKQFLRDIINNIAQTRKIKVNLKEILNGSTSMMQFLTSANELRMTDFGVILGNNSDNLFVQIAGDDQYLTQQNLKHYLQC